jgi:hypothetical protein
MTEKTAKSIINMVNQELNLNLTFDFLDHNYIYTFANRGARYLIICYGYSGRYFVRSVVKPINKNKSFSFLCNGQANRNCKQVAFWDENHVYNVTDEELWEEFKSSIIRNFDSLSEEDIIKSIKVRRYDEERLLECMKKFHTKKVENCC